MNKFFLSITLSLLLIGYVILDLFINDDLWNVSTSFALSMQKEIPAAEQIIYEIFTYIVFIPPIAAVYCFIFENNKLNALLYLTVTVMSVTANEILKNLYHQARPYMIEMEIQSLKCNSDYGKPSGHSMNSVVMIFLMPFLLFPQLRKLRKSEVNVEMPQHSQSHTGYTIASYDIPEQKDNKIFIDVHEQSSIHIVLKIGLILFFIASVVMTGISRVFLGVHSLGQVFLGWAYGIYIASMYIFVFHDSIKGYIIKLMDPQSNKLGESRHLIPMCLLSLLIILGLSLGILKVNELIFYEHQDMNVWIERINDCKGTEYNKKSRQILYNSCFLTTAICAIITGLLIGGILVQGSYAEGEFTKRKNIQTARFFFYRILMLIVPFCILIPFIFIDSENVVVQTITQILPVSFGVGLIINCIYPYLLRKFGLQIPGDFLYFDQQKFLLQNINDSLDVQLRKHENSYQNTL